MNVRVTSLALLIFVLLATGNAGAATLDQTFTNDFETNGIYLWSVDPSNMTLAGFSFGANMSGWKADSQSPAKLVLSGPTLGAAAGRFNLLMNYQNTPFKLEWAEVFFDNMSNAVRGYGTLTFNGSGWSNGNVATHLMDIPLHPVAAATPIPPSLLLMVSALALVPLQRLRRRAAA